jgi:hypothetical protein
MSEKKKQIGIRLSERRKRILEALGEEIPRQTNYPAATVTKLIETAIDRYILLLAEEREAYKALIEKVGSEFDRQSAQESPSTQRKGPSLVADTRKPSEGRSYGQKKES